jgi:hypothetical protein
MGQLPNNFAGSAVVTSDQPIVAIANETNSGSPGAMSFNTLTNGGSTFYLPVVMNNASGITTGVAIKNLGAAATVTINYYNSNGTAAGTESRLLGAGGSWGVYQGSSGLSNGFAGCAVITCSQPLLAIVNQSGTGGKVMSYSGDS